MSADAEAPTGRPAGSSRLRFFRPGGGLRAGTTQRFVLLIILFLSSSVAMFGQLLSPLTDPNGMSQGCELAAGVNPDVNSTANYLDMGAPAYARCLDTYAGGWEYVWLPCLLTLLLLVFVVLFYMLFPRWKARPGKVVRLRGDDSDPALYEALAALVERSSLTPSPTFVVDLSAHSANAVVFGRLGRYTVQLNAGLVALFGRDRAAFEATVLHEFAHIRSRDVDLTYLTVAVWRLFLLFALTPFVVVEGWRLVRGELLDGPSLFWPGQAPALARNMMLSAFMVALMKLATADVLRSREIHADIDAVRQRADRTYWARRAEAAPRRRTGPRVLKAVPSALLTHPDWGTRKAALDDPSVLFTVQAPTMFLTGAAAAILGYFLAISPGTGMYLARFSWLPSFSIWPAAVLTTSVAGVAVWRNVVYSIRNGTIPPSGLRAGLWLGVGQLAGELLLSQSLGSQWLLPFPEALLLLLFALVPTAVIWWTAGCASLWADLPSGRRRLAASASTLAVTGLAFAWWYDWWQQEGTVYASGNPFPAQSTYATDYSGFTHTTTVGIMATLSEPIALITIDWWSVWLTAALWLMPLIGRARRNRHRAADRTDPGRPPGRRARLLSRIRSLPSSTVPGLLGGGLSGLGILLITSRAHSWLQHRDLPAFENIYVYLAWVFAILLCGIVGAALVAAFISRGDAASAMSAAGSAMAVGLTVLFAVRETDGCVTPLSTLNFTCMPASRADWVLFTYPVQYLLGMAGITSLAAAALVAGISDRSNPPAHPTAPTNAPRRRHRLIWTTATCLIIAGMCSAAYTSGTSTSGPSNPSQPQMPAPTVNTSVASGQLLTQQVRAWAYFGGTDRAGQYAKSLMAVVTAAPHGHINPPAMRAACTGMIDTVKDIDDYFPLPDGQQPTWSAALTDTSKAAHQCLTGLSASNDPVLLAALSELESASSQMDIIESRLVDESSR